MVTDDQRTASLVIPHDVPSLAQADSLSIPRADYDAALWKLRTLVEGIPHLVWRSCDLGNWTWASPQWQAYTGQTQEQSLGLGWLDVVHPDDRAAATEGWAEARPHGKLDVEFRVRCASDGTYIWHHTRSAPARNEAGEIVEWLGTTSDIHERKMLQEKQTKLMSQLQQHADALTAEIRERKRIEAQLSYTAYHDDLTKLRNRPFFMGELTRVLSQFRTTSSRGTAILILDLDYFKQVNDSLGHAAGDMLLTVLGRRLKTCVGEDNLVARLGGDEFGIIAEGLDEASLLDLVTRVQNAIQRPTKFGRREIVSSCCVGVTWITVTHAKPEDMLQEADIAMYEAKRGARGSFRIFDEPMRIAASGVLDLHNDLRSAVANRELELHYQPIWDTAARIVIGFEALVRWRHPRLGLLGPDKFIPMAEESGLIRSIGSWVLQEGCDQMKRWRDQDPTLRALTLSVNVSGDELKDPTFVAGVDAALTTAGLNAECLELEITEGVLLVQSLTVVDTLAALRRLGVRIAIDDFGIGYSSLDYLNRYDIDTVKIDKSFTSRMQAEHRSRVILQAIIDLGRALSMRIVAEGVENEEQYSLLDTMRCDAVQGFLLGRPYPAHQVLLMSELKFQ